MRKFEEAQQIAAEFDWFMNILKRENVRSYLEIGSRLGGSLWKAANALPVPSQITSIDLPQGTEPHLKECVDEIRKMGHDVELILGDSTAPDIIERAKVRGPFDAVFIDANHTAPYVWKDWNTYGTLAPIIAFHDINWKGPRPGKLPINVPEIWNEIKKGFKHEEIRLDARDNGIGVLWR